MEVVCEGTQSTDTQVKVVALQCLEKIMHLCHKYMEACTYCTSSFLGKC